MVCVVFPSCSSELEDVENGLLRGQGESPPDSPVRRNTLGKFRLRGRGQEAGVLGGGRE